MKIHFSFLRTILLCLCYFFITPHLCDAGEGDEQRLPQKRMGEVLQGNPKKPPRQNLMALYGCDDEKELLAEKSDHQVLEDVRYAPIFHTHLYTFQSFEELKSLEFHPDSTAFVADFDETFGQRLFKVIPKDGDPFEIRYASSGDWNSNMYEPFFIEALSAIGKTTREFDQLFKYFKNDVAYALLDPSFLSLDLSTVHTKVIVSGHKDNASKQELYKPYGFSYASSRNKSSKIATLLSKDPLITHIIFIDNDSKNIQNVKNNLVQQWKITYNHPTSIRLDIVQFDYFQMQLKSHTKELQKEIHKMFEYVEMKIFFH